MWYELAELPEGLVFGTAAKQEHFKHFFCATARHRKLPGGRLMVCRRNGSTIARESMCDRCR